MAKKIDEILEFLALDGSLYSVKDISITLNIPQGKCEETMHFLAKYGFVKASGKDFQINPTIGDFLLGTSEESVLQTIISE